MDITSSYAYYYAYYSREYSTLVVLIEYDDDDDVIGLRDPTLPRRTHPVFFGWGGVARLGRVGGLP